MTDRHLIVVDTETTGLDMDRAVAVELAAVNVTTGEEFYLVPWVDRTEFARFDPEALTVNRYFERRLFEQVSHNTAAELWNFVEFMDGHTFAGSNPRYDAVLIEKMFGKYDIEPTWHHRLADISPYAAGALALDPTDLPGLARICDALGVENEDPHSALGDARATAECFRRVGEIQKNRGLR